MPMNNFVKRHTRVIDRLKVQYNVLLILMENAEELVKMSCALLNIQASKIIDQ